MNNEVLFSRKSDEWETPKHLFNDLNKIYNFTLDPAATHENHLCDKYYTKEDDGLSKDWSNEVVFLNPPYSQIKKWLKKACDEYENNGSTVICLIPHRSDTKYYFDYVLNSNIIYLIKGRLKFYNKLISNSDKPMPAPFPSIIVCFDHGINPNNKYAMPEFRIWQ